MIWILTLILCLGLIAAIAAITNPHLIEETIGRHWKNNTFYRH